MKKICIFLLLVLPVIGFSQNLLLNGGFEDENICTEYKINCAPEAWISSGGSALANYFKDANRAYAGEHCMAIEAGHMTAPYRRTFIRSPLLCQLKKGNTYRLSLYIKSPHPILDSVGVYFGPIDPLLERKPIHLLSASLYLGASNKFIKDSSWQKASLEYTAAGNELFITIANFSRNDINGNTGIRRQNLFFVYFDEISLVPVDTAEALCGNWQEVKEDIYTQNERHQYLQRILTLRQNNPLQKVLPGPTLSPSSVSLILPDVLFATAKKELRPASFTILDSFCKSFSGKFIDSVVVEGHTDNTGTSSINQQLSLARAESAAAYLRNCNTLSKAAFITRGWSSRKPLNSNSTPAERQKNRRVELVVYYRE